MRALVVFTESPVKHLTHCFTIVNAHGDYWVRLDGAYGKITVDVVGEPDPEAIRSQGYPVFEVAVGGHRLYAPVQPFSCVSLVKRTTGIRAPFIITSKQLHDYLKESRNG